MRRSPRFVLDARSVSLHVLGFSTHACDVGPRRLGRRLAATSPRDDDKGRSTGEHVSVFRHVSERSSSLKMRGFYGRCVEGALAARIATGATKRRSGNEMA